MKRLSLTISVPITDRNMKAIKHGDKETIFTSLWTALDNHFDGSGEAVNVVDFKEINDSKEEERASGSPSAEEGLPSKHDA